jgi:hypothetical protein
MRNLKSPATGFSAGVRKSETIALSNPIMPIGERSAVGTSGSIGVATRESVILRHCERMSRAQASSGVMHSLRLSLLFGVVKDLRAIGIQDGFTMILST